MALLGILVSSLNLSAYSGDHVHQNTQLEMWVTNRLKELFPYVAKPYTLYNNGRPLFTFYFAVSNQNKSAWRLADRAVQYILKN